MLITKHILFVGFSLSDDNFHRIAEDVRKAVCGDGQGESSKFGTALTVDDNLLFRDLWSQDLDWVTFSQSTSDPDLAVAGRRQEIFLDYLAAKAGPDSRHLLDARFEHVLSEPERKLSAALGAFPATLPKDAQGTTAWEQVRQTLVRLGYRENASGAGKTG